MIRANKGKELQMVNYNCKKCIHNPICSYAADATKEAREFNYASKLAVIEYDLRCKHYTSVGYTREGYMND